MKPTNHLASFIFRAATDIRLLPSHLSLFMAVYYFSNDEAPNEAVTVSRCKLMRFSRIRSISTYHKCIRELVDYLYIHYEPSYDPREASRIWLLDADG